MTRLRRTIGRVLTAAGALALGYTALPVASVTAEHAIPGAIGRLAIPRLGLTTLIVEGGWAAATGVGHLADTALPGEWGNIVVAGDRASFFRLVQRVRVGDTITLDTPVGEFAYQVDSAAVVASGDTRALDPTLGRTLTVMAGVPAAAAGPARDRFIVHARDLGTPRS